MSTRSLSFRAAILALGNGTAAVVRLAIVAVLARKFTETDLGTYKQTYLVYTFVLPLIGLGLPSALLYFLPRQESRARAIVSENLLMLIFSGGLLSALLFLGGADFVASQFSNPELATTLRWFAIVPLFGLPLLAVPPGLTAQSRPLAVAAFSISSGLVRMLLVLVPVLLFSATPLIAIQGSALAVVVMFVPGLWLLYRSLPKGGDRPTTAGMLEQASYAIPLGLGSMIGVIHKGMDKLIVSKMTAPDIYAVFSNGALEIPFVSLITGSAAAVLVPELSRMFAGGRHADAVALFRRSAVKCGQLLAPIAGWFFVCAPWVMRWLYGAKYVDSYPVFQIYLLILPLRVAFFGPLFQAANRSDLVLKRSIIGLVGNIFLTVIGVWLFGPIGAAIGTVLSILLFAYSFCLVASARLYKTTILGLLPWQDLLRLFVPVVLIVAVLAKISTYLQLLESLTLISWGVLSLSYFVSVVVSYMVLGVVTVSEIRDHTQALIGKLKSAIGNVHG